MALDRGKLLRAIAAALRRQPAISYQQLAEIVGIGRRTLYNLAPTREALYEMLRQEAVASCARGLSHADLERSDVRDGLQKLTENFLADNDLFSFWVADTWGKEPGAQVSRSDEQYAAFRQTMVAFFRRGQREGVFRIDMPAEWLSQFYDALLFTSNQSVASGQVAHSDLPRLFMESFLHGATDRVAAQETI